MWLFFSYFRKYFNIFCFENYIYIYKNCLFKRPYIVDSFTTCIIFLFSYSSYAILLFQLIVNLKDWTLFLDKQNDSLEHVEDSHLVLLEVYQPEDPEGFLSKSLSIPKGKRVKVIINLDLDLEFFCSHSFCYIRLNSDFLYMWHCL